MTSLTIGLLGIDALVTARILMSDLGQTSKKIGLAVVAAFAIADLALIQYLRRRHPELRRRPTADE
jgi:hypothetical protein